jgi:hypothetical protein
MQLKNVIAHDLNESAMRQSNILVQFLFAICHSNVLLQFLAPTTNHITFTCIYYCCQYIELQ